MNHIENILQSFDPILLEEMDQVKLMDRIDTKFVYRIDQLPDLLQDASKSYKVLEINQKRLFQYDTLYLDTFDNQMYMEHHNGNLNRYKIRFRNYVDSNKIFLEVKFKTNTGRTIKKRIKRKSIDKLDSKKARAFVESKTSYLYDSLEPKMSSKFFRATLVHKAMTERITIDVNLSYYNDSDEQDVSYLSIAEIKQGKFAENSDFYQILQSHRIHPTPFSKYCLGRILLDKDLKQNRFKTKLVTLNKLQHDNRPIHLVG